MSYLHSSIFQVQWTEKCSSYSPRRVECCFYQLTSRLFPLYVYYTIQISIGNIRRLLKYVRVDAGGKKAFKSIYYVIRLQQYMQYVIIGFQGTFNFDRDSSAIDVKNNRFHSLFIHKEEVLCWVHSVDIITHPIFASYYILQ